MTFKYQSSFRIDHILGFFRIWEIPRNCVTGLLGRFYPSYPITRYELESRGIWDINRLITPYIRMHTILNLFGQDFQDIIQKYLNVDGNHNFSLKPEFDCERKIAVKIFIFISKFLFCLTRTTYFYFFFKDSLPIEKVKEEVAQKNKEIRSRLFSLVQNVILLVDDEDPNKFYPRIELMKTSSFQELDHYQQRIIQDLYYE